MSPEPPLKRGSPRNPALTAAVRCLLLVLAVLSLALGIVGVFLPVLPTVPFLLLAAWAAGLSSPRLSQWLENHPRFGSQIRAWQHGGVVSRRAKWTATLVMTSSVITTLLLQAHWAALAAAAAMACVLVWLWRRPEQETQ